MSDELDQSLADALALGAAAKSIDSPDTPEDVRRLLQALAGPIADRLEASLMREDEAEGAEG